MKRLFLVLFFLTFPILVQAGAARFFDQPDTAFVSNTAVDIISHNNGVWLATGNGVNYSYDFGLHWLVYDSANGLPSSDISALLSQNGRILAASSHIQIFAGSPLSFSDGLSYSDNNGLLWHRIRFDALTPSIKGAMGAYCNIYDLAGYHDTHRNRDWVFATMWAGGILASMDNGTSWRRIYPSRADSLNFDSVISNSDSTVTVSPNYDNLAFSCVTDTSHGDSLFLWEGTVSGVFQYVFAPRNEKFGTKKVTSMSFCDDCSLAGKSYVFYGGSAGLVRGTTAGGPYITKDTSNSISSVHSYRGKLFFGENDPIGGTSNGLFVSNDQAATYSHVNLPAVEGANHNIVGFASIGSRLYMAAQQAGLFLSTDTGQTWTHLWVDSADTSGANMRNAVYALDAQADTLRIGTDSGLVTWFLSPVGAVDSSRSQIVPEDTTSFRRVVKIAVQKYGTQDTLSANDSSSVWVISRSSNPLTVPSLVSRFSKGTNDWQQYEQEISTNDIGFVADAAVFCSEYGIRFTPDAAAVYWLRVKDALDSTIVMSDSGFVRARDTVNAIIVKKDTVILAGNHTVARSLNGMSTFRVFAPNLDSLKADLVINYNYSNTLNLLDSVTLSVGLTGNFVPALGIQYVPGQKARIFASGRQATSSSEYEGVSWARQIPIMDTLNETLGYKYRWDFIKGIPTFAWNFGNASDTLLVPTDSGLYLVNGLGTVNQDVTKFTFVDSLAREVLRPGVSIYTARAIDSFIWVGSDRGTVRIRRGNGGDQVITRVTDGSPQVYAFPTPFSPNEGEAADFHFNLASDGYVTLEIYDYALNLVARPIDHQFFAAGAHPGAHETGLRTWNGRNGNNDVVAVGVYYIKLTSSTGEVAWGKLAVIP